MKSPVGIRFATVRLRMRMQRLNGATNTTPKRKRRWYQKDYPVADFVLKLLVASGIAARHPEAEVVKCAGFRVVYVCTHCGHDQWLHVCGADEAPTFATCKVCGSAAQAMSCTILPIPSVDGGGSGASSTSSPVTPRAVTVTDIRIGNISEIRFLSNGMVELAIEDGVEWWLPRFRPVSSDDRNLVCVWERLG